MASWMTNWAERGGSFLNSFDSRVASFLNNDDSVVSQEKFTPLTTFDIMTADVIPSTVANVSTTKQSVVDTTSAHSSECLNSVFSTDREISTVHAPFSAILSSPKQSQASLSDSTQGIATENRLLHQEVASLNQEIAELVKRNKRAENEAQDRSNEIKELRLQIQSLKARLEESKKKALSQPNSRPNSGCEDAKNLQIQVEKLTKTLATTRQALTESETKAEEALKLADLSSGRVEQLQHEVALLTRSLMTYKEKAAAILSDKEKIITALRDQLGAGGAGNPSSTSNADDNLRMEYEQLREETISLRREAEQRLLTASEMEERAFEEHALLRRTINLMEQQLQSEKQLVIDSDAEIIELQRRLAEVTEEATREKAASVSRMQAVEEEMESLRKRLMYETSSPPISPPSQQPQLRTDMEARVFELEARTRYLNDSLITKQDALEATLAQNHALKIRLERLEAECDARLFDTSRPQSTSFASVYPQLPQNSSPMSYHGFARLHLIDASLPTWLRGLVGDVDDWTIRLVAMLRRRPLIRLLSILYLGVFHIWLLCSLIFFAPSLTTSPPPLHP